MKGRTQYTRISFLTKFILFAACFFAAFTTHAAGKNTSLMAIKAADELAVLSQSVVKDYFYIAKGLNVTQSTAQLTKYQKQILRHLKFLKATVSGANEKNMLDFMEIAEQEMTELVNQPYSEDNAYLVMDISEVLLEGAHAIKVELDKNSRSNHKMLDLAENQLFLVERMAKLYIAAQHGIYDFNSKQQMKDAIQAFDTGINKLNKYDYPDSQKAKVSRVKKHWQSARYFYEDAETGTLPSTVFLATQLIVYPLNTLVTYHSGQRG